MTDAKYGTKILVKYITVMLAPVVIEDKNKGIACQADIII